MYAMNTKKIMTGCSNTIAAPPNIACKKKYLKDNLNIFITLSYL